MTDFNGSGNDKHSLPDFQDRLSALSGEGNEEDMLVLDLSDDIPPEDAFCEDNICYDEAPLPEENIEGAYEEGAGEARSLPAAPLPAEGTVPRPRPKQPRPVNSSQGAKKPGGSTKSRPASAAGGTQKNKKPAPGKQSAKKPTSSRKARDIENDDEYLARKRNNPFRVFFRFLGRTLETLLWTLLVLVIALAVAITIVCRGPSTEARRLFVCSTNETSALKSVPRYFLPGSVVDEILHPVVEEVAPDTFVELPTELEAIAKAEQGEPELVQIDEKAAQKDLELVDVRGNTFKGKMLIIHDPNKVKLASLDQFGEYGIFLTEFIERSGAIAGTNAGGFYDPNGQGNGGTPDGLVIRNGVIAFGSPYNRYVDVIGFDGNRVLHVGDMTGQEALDMGIVEAISFSAGPVLIQDGVKRTGLGGGVNPRTCIGQRADGAVLLMVLEGRHPDSLGATYDDIANLMESYGAVNAGNLDGGSSSTMIYNGEQITKGSTIVGSRRMATAILVLP